MYHIPPLFTTSLRILFKQKFSFKNIVRNCSLLSHITTKQHRQQQNKRLNYRIAHFSPSIFSLYIFCHNLKHFRYCLIGKNIQELTTNKIAPSKKVLFFIQSTVIITTEDTLLIFTYNFHFCFKLDIEFLFHCLLNMLN